jgi:hypothetical protein
MIVYIRGRLDGPPNARAILIRTDHGRIEARAYAPPSVLAQGDDVVAASAPVAVGVTHDEHIAFLGPWPSDRPDPGGPLGLASTPVILLPDRSTVDVALAGVDRAGRSPAVARLEGPTLDLGLAVLRAAASGAEVVALVDAEGRHIDLVRILGGRAVVALPASDPAGARAWLGDAELGADIPVPITDERVSAEIAALGLETTHQLVQVDPTPALDAVGTRVDDSSLRIVTAAASGLLAGRIAMGNRRWREAVDP